MISIYLHNPNANHVLLWFLLMSCCGLASAESITIKSDEQSGTEAEAMVFKGNVVVDFESLQIRADQMEVTRDASDAISLLAQSKSDELVHIEVKGEVSQTAVVAQAQEVAYTHETGELVLKGDAQIFEGRNVVAAHSITYNIQTGAFKAAKALDGPKVVTKIDLGDSSSSSKESGP